MKLTELLKELSTLNLPKDQYAITSSGVLAAHGIREANDLDVLVTDDLWTKISQQYSINKELLFKIEIGNIEILGPGSAFRDQGIASINEIINSAEIINGYPFVKLNLIKQFKAKLGRDKDLKDIALIDQFLIKQI